MRSKYNKVYVCLPENYTTGGVELGHQLIDYLRKCEIFAYAVYFNSQNQISPNVEVPVMYKKYDIKISTYIDDSEENIVVIPETKPELARMLKKCKIAFWWMSVDNFTSRYLSIKPFTYNTNKSFFKNIKKNIRILLSRLPLASTDILCFFRKNKDRIFHLYQSEYARQYIIKNNLGYHERLSDYINPDLFPNVKINRKSKKDIVLYNPAKGYEFTKKIIDSCPKIKFVALKGMNREELNKVFDSAKLYIDFGNFPGKDRLPREAVLHDCCVITGRQGASAYYEDVPINDEFKFNADESNIQDITNKIVYILNNYDEVVEYFDVYRKIVAQEQNLFYKEIQHIFILNND
jgi:hypothetical protein